MKGSPDVTKMTTEEIQKAAEIKKAAAIEKMKKAHKAHNEVGSCLHGYCDHGDTSKCMEKAAEAHEAIKSALEDPDETDETKEEKSKAAKADAEKKEAEKAEVIKRAKELGIALVEAPVVDPKLAELEKELTALKAEVAKGASVERQRPVVRGAVVSKVDDNPNDKDVKKFAAIKKDDPDAVAKAASAVFSAEETVID